MLLHEPDYFKPLVNHIAKHVGIKNKRILEFGCGAGNLAFLLLENGAQGVLGVDIANIAIQKAQKEAKRRNIDNIKFVCGNVLELDLPSEMDMIVSHSVFQYIVDDWQPILRKLSDSLTPGGTLIATVETNATMLKLMQTLNLHFLPELIKKRLHLLLNIFMKKRSKADHEIIESKFRYLAIPPLSLKSEGELISEFTKACFSKVRIVDSIKLHKLSRPHLTIIANK